MLDNTDRDRRGCARISIGRWCSTLPIVIRERRSHGGHVARGQRGRLLLGLGAGGGRETPYAAEQLALGRTVPGDAARRRWVEDAVARVRAVWSGESGGASGFLRPEPPPPIIIGGFGPKMAELAGRIGDGINAPGGPGAGKLIEIAREAHARSGRDPATFVVTASTGPRGHERLAELGVSRVIIFVRAPYADGCRTGARGTYG